MTQPFYFPDGRLANNANDLLELCKQYPDDATNFLVKEDLEKWLAYIGSHDVAACAANARQTDLGDRQKLEEFLTRCHALTAAKPVATPETPLKDQESVSESVAPPAEVPPEPVVTTPPVAQPEPVAAPTPPPPAPETITPPPPKTPPKVTPTAVKTPVNNNVTDNEEKPGFFQVVAKFVMRIFYRDQA